MQFEEALRVKATTFMNEGGTHNGGAPQDIKGAMEAARKDNNLLNKEFLQKLMFQSGSSTNTSGREDLSVSDDPIPKGKGRKAQLKANANQNNRGGEGKSKGKGKGSDKTLKGARIHQVEFKDPSAGEQADLLRLR